MKKWLLAGIGLLYVFGVSAQDSTALKLDELIVAYQKSGKFNGTALIANSKGILLEKGYGYRDFRHKLPNDTTTIFAIASVTKTFTSAMVLRLVQEHRIALSDKLLRWYPHFPHAADITISQLLSHTSGIYDYTHSAEHVEVSNEAKMMAFLGKQPLDFKPGTAWRYSNSGYFILGFIISKVTGITYEQSIRRFLFKPAGMKRSGFDSNLKDQERAIGYSLDDTVRTPMPPSDSSAVFAAGAINSTAGDLYRWHLALQSYRVVSKPLLNAAYTRVKQNYGFGWIIDSIGGKRVVYHSGNIAGFCSLIMRIPEDGVCIVLLNNQEGTELEGIGRGLLDIVYHRPYKLPVKKVAIQLPDSLMNRYVGIYDVPGMHAVVEVSVKTGVLVVHIVNSPTTFGFLPESTNRFFFNDGQTELEFRTNKDGKMEMAIYQNNQQITGQKR